MLQRICSGIIGMLFIHVFSRAYLLLEQDLNREGEEAGSDADGAEAEDGGGDGDGSDFDDYIDALQHEGDSS